MNLLRSRVFPRDSPEIPSNTLYVFPKKKNVKKYNEKMINLLEGDNEVLVATNIMTTRKQFDPQVDESDGKIKGTPLTQILYLKRNAKIVLIHNLDVNDF